MNSKLPIKIAAYHVIGITSFILFEMVLLFFHKSNANFWEFAGYYLFDFVFFYTSAYQFIKGLKNITYRIDLRFIFISLIWIGIFTFADILFTYFLYSLRERTLTNQEVKIFTAKLFFRFTYFYFLAYGLWSARSLVKRERENRIKDVALLTSKNEKAHIEIALLRSQITPHLLLNTLNGVYNLVMSTNSKAAVMVELLMDNLHLSLKGSDPEKETTLADEVQLIKNLVRLYAQLGKSNCQLKIILDAYIQERPFPVNIVATMVENIFKHGDLTDATHPARIMIRNEQSKLLVSLYNKVAPTRQNKKSGIGMENIEKRLTLLFKNRYELHIAHTEEYYQTDFQIEI
jgi:two-component system LytT family sensor kinase